MSNAFQRLLGLTNIGPRTVATVTALNTDGTSTVQLMSGQTIIVLGSAVPEGNKAYIEGGRIIGQAAALPYSEITV